MFVLPGSDPLPFKAQAKNCGRYGFYLKGKRDENYPGKVLKKMICDLKVQPPIYGLREGLMNFFRYQIAIQIGKQCSRFQHR